MKTRKSRKIFGGAGEDFTEIYNKFYKKQLDARIPISLSKLITLIKTEISSKYSSLEESTVSDEATKLANAIIRDINIKKAADDEIAKTVELDQVIVEKIQKTYDMNITKSVNPDFAFEKNKIRQMLTMSLGINNSILINRYLEALIDPVVNNVQEPQNILDDGVMSDEKMETLMRPKLYLVMREMFINLMTQIKLDEMEMKKNTDTTKLQQKIIELERRKLKMIEIMREKYFPYQATILKSFIKLVKAKNKPGYKKTAEDAIVLMSAGKTFNELLALLTEEGFNEDIQTLTSNTEAEVPKVLKKMKEEEIEKERKQGTEATRLEKNRIKNEYIKGFKERNGEEGEVFINNVLSSLSNAVGEAADLEKDFPLESKKDFWNIVLGRQWKPNIAKEVVEKVKNTSSAKESFNVHVTEIPDPWAIAVNTKLNKFELNQNGSFVNADGKIVDVFGDEIIHEMNGGGCRRSKKRGRMSRKRNGRKLSSRTK